jgi:hypothetical protein
MTRHLTPAEQEIHALAAKKGITKAAAAAEIAHAAAMKAEAAKAAAEVVDEPTDIE